LTKHTIFKFQAVRPRA